MISGSTTRWVLPLRTPSITVPPVRAIKEVYFLWPARTVNENDAQPGREANDSDFRNDSEMPLERQRCVFASSTKPKSRKVRTMLSSFSGRVDSLFFNALASSCQDVFARLSK